MEHNPTHMRAPVLQQPISSIVIFRALYLGDLLCATPALRALRQHFPESEITLIGLPWARELTQRLSSVDRLLEFPGYPGIVEVEHQPERTQAFLREARAAHYDLAIQMHGDGNISNGFVADLGAKMSLGYRRASDERLTHSLPYESGEHETLHWLRLVAEVGAVSDDSRLEFPLLPEDHAEAAALLPDSSDQIGPLVGLHAGAKDAARRWPPERFAALADALVEQYHARIVLTGGAHERDLTAAVQQAMRHSALDLAGRTKLGSFAALIARLDLLVTNDTGASHLAAAASTPSVILFGPTRPAQWAPLDRKRHRAVDATALAPHVDPAAALAQLPVESVLAACAEVLESQGSKIRNRDDHDFRSRLLVRHD